MNKKTTWMLAASAAAVLAVVGCTTMKAGGPDRDRLAQDMLRTGFVSKGIATTDRIAGVDETLKLCTQADVSGQPLDAATAERIEQENLKTIRWPADGKFLGDWKQGEKIAQSGKGETWSDKPGEANGGNCYNCHQIQKKEISFGTIGPSLYHYGRLRGVSDPSSPAAKAIVEYTWGKIWNAKAYNACSLMPRAVHNLTEQQVRDLMALLLDPKSPVNAD